MGFDESFEVAQGAALTNEVVDRQVVGSAGRYLAIM